MRRTAGWLEQKAVLQRAVKPSEYLGARREGHLDIWRGRRDERPVSVGGQRNVGHGDPVEVPTLSVGLALAAR